MYIAKHFDNNYFCSLVINMQWFWQSVCFSSGNACCCTWLCTLSHKQNLVWVRHDCRTLLRERTAMCIDRRITLCSGYSCNSWRQTDVNSRVSFLLICLEQSREIRYNFRKLDGFPSQTELKTGILCQELIYDGIRQEHLVYRQ